MIDLHSHVLPGIDDGSPDDGSSLQMARMAVADGITVQACTPHMFPGVYDNSGPDVRARVARLQAQLDDHGIPLQLVTGADVHIVPDLVARLRNGAALTLNDTRYVLIETPHHVLPPRADDVFFNLLAAGYVPVFTHPERMTWIEQRFDFIKSLVKAGCWMQLTAGALVGKFGRKPKYWSERMLDEGLFHIVATDAHDTIRRPPALREAFDVLCGRVGETEALQMSLHRPLGILGNRLASELAPPIATHSEAAAEPIWRRIGNLIGGR